MKSLMYFGLLAILVFFGFQYFVKPKPPAPAPQTQNQTQTQTAPAESQQATPPGPAGASAASGGKASSASPVAVASTETLTTVENADYRIVFSNRGGLVQHWILKHYFDSTGKPLDMVQEQSAQRFGFPLSLF